MEPLAPGTEDEYVMPQITKKETEKERLLSQKAYLSNGQYGNIFELSFLNGAEHWYCKVCNCPVMGRVYHHEIGKRHTNNLFANNKHLVKGDQTFDDPETVEQRIEIAPGEPVPPGFEDEISKVSRIQERLNGYSVGPLVGLEYLLELQDSDISKEPSYLCILCDKKGDPRTVLTHLASYNHISQFLQKHFPTCYRALTPYMTKQYKRNWQGAIQTIAEAIERKFGRLKPMPVEIDNFEKNRMVFLEKILKGKHFYETPGSNFEELVKKEDLTKAPEEEVVKAEENVPVKKSQPQPRRKSPSPPVVQRPSWKPRVAPTAATKKPSYAQNKKKSLSPVSSASSSDTETNNAQKKFRQRSPVQNRGMYERRNFNRRSPTPTKTRESMPWKRPDYMKTKLSKTQDRSPKGDKNEKLEEFKKLAKAIETDMERVLKQHEKNPEKHPRYNEEWKRFWNKRYKELQFEGKDASKHDFKPEWILFWNRRMREIHDEEIKIQKEALRKRLGILEETPAPIRFRIGSANSKENTQQKPIPPAACPDSDPEVIIIEDKDDVITVGSNRSGRTFRQSQSPKRPSSPRKKSPRRSRSPARHRNRSPRKSRSPQRVRGSPQRRSPRRTRSPDQRRTRSPIRRRTRSPLRQRARSPRGSRSPKRSHSPWEAEPISKSRKVDSKAGRKSLDRLSLDRISSSGSEHDFEEVAKQKPREGHIKSRPRDYGVEYVRERNLDYRGLPYGRPPIQPPPWETDRRFYYEYDEYKPPKIMRDVTREPMQDGDDDEEVNVVSVLRLLTALEEKLGSLGPKVNDLLSQALGMEKDKANSSEALLDNEVNCVLFETVKEKLKGQMLAGLIDYIQENAYKKAIKKTANLIHLANKRKQQKRESKIDPVRVPGVGTVDKAAIAKQIATALVKQGKTDVTQDELEQLINAVVGMAEASQKSDKPMTTADFIEKLSGVKKELETPKSVKKDESFSEKCVKLREPSDKSETETVKKDISNSNSMEHLSDSDLQTLLQNFKDLSTEEQQNLITYLKTLEAHEPERVEKLRKFVNLGMENSENSSEKKASDVIELDKPNSPFLERQGGVNPESVQKRKTVINLAELEEKAIEKVEKEEDRQMEKIDSDEEDYSFEDVVKAASKNVEEKELAKKATEAETKKKAEKDKLNETQSIITNLLSSFSKISNNSTSSTTNVTAADFSKTLSSLTITVDSLANIVGNVKTMEANQKKDCTSRIDIFEDDSNSKLSTISGLHSTASNTILGDQDKLSGRAFSEQDNSNIGREQSFTNNLLDSVCDGPGQLNKKGFSDQSSRLGPAMNFPEQFERPEESYQRQNQTYERPGINFERPGPGFDRVGFDKQGPGFNRQGPVFDRQMQGFERPGPVFDRPNLNFERQGPSLDRQGLGSDRPNQGFARQGPGFNGQNQNPPFEQSDFGYERGEFQNRSSPGFNFDRQGIRLPLRNDQERLRSDQVDEFDIPGPELADRRPPDFDRFGPGFGRSGNRGLAMDNPASYQRNDPFVPFSNPDREQFSHAGPPPNMFRGKNPFPGPVNQNFQQQRGGTHDFGFDNRRGGFRR